MHSIYSEVHEELNDYKEQLVEPDEGMPVEVSAQSAWPYQIVRAYKLYKSVLI